MRDLSLRRELTRRLITALVSVGVIGGIATYLMAYRYANTTYDHELLESAEILGDQLSMHGGRMTLDLPPAARAVLVNDDNDTIRYRVTDLVTHRAVDGNGDIGPHLDAPTQPDHPIYRDSHLGPHRFRIVALRVDLPPDHHPALIEVGETVHKRGLLIRDIVVGTLILLLCMVTASLVLVRRGIRRTLQPLQLLEIEASRRTSQNLAPLDPKLAPQEVRHLIDAINRMMARLNDAIEAQRRFVSNAAHQLRTPLAGLRLQAELARKAGGNGPSAELIDEIEHNATRTSHIIEQLLTLSRAEAGAGDFGQTLDLGELARRTTERFVPRALDQQADLGFDGPDHPQWVLGNAVLLEELLANLIDNALRYGGDLITVAVSPQSSQPELSIADNGPGIPTEARGAVFQRFYRSDSARTDSSQPGGAGLGLAIVQEIAERHGATIWLEEGDTGGCVFRVRFPRTSPP